MVLNTILSLEHTNKRTYKQFRNKNNNAKLKD